MFFILIFQSIGDRVTETKLFKKSYSFLKNFPDVDNILRSRSKTDDKSHAKVVVYRRIWNFL